MSDDRPNHLEEYQARKRRIAALLAGEPEPEPTEEETDD